MTNPPTSHGPAERRGAPGVIARPEIVGSLGRALPPCLYLACAGEEGSALEFLTAAGIDLIHVDNASRLIRSRLSTGSILLDLDVQQECVSTIASLLAAGGIHMPLMVTTARPSVADAVQWMKRGAKDYIIKPYEAAEFLERLSVTWADFIQNSIGRSTETDIRLKRLTFRQRAVLELLSHGLTSKEIGNHMSLSVRTVEMHRERMLKALGASSTAEALVIATRLRLVPRTTPNSA